MQSNQGYLETRYRQSYRILIDALITALADSSVSSTGNYAVFLILYDNFARNNPGFDTNLDLGRLKTIFTKLEAS
ncbi:MAG: hypothetical protein V7K47_19915 [Nostoc sp.]